MFSARDERLPQTATSLDQSAGTQRKGSVMPLIRMNKQRLRQNRNSNQSYEKRVQSNDLTSDDVDAMSPFERNHFFLRNIEKQTQVCVSLRHCMNVIIFTIMPEIQNKFSSLVQKILNPVQKINQYTTAW